MCAVKRAEAGATGRVLAACCQRAPYYPTGEAGYLLLAANFERFRQKSRAELSSQDQVGRVKAVRGLLPFIDAFEPLQATVDEAAPEAKVHSFYAGVYKQFNTLLDSWEVRSPPVSRRSSALHARAHRTRAPHARTTCAHRMRARAPAAPQPPPPHPPFPTDALLPVLWQVEGYEAVVGEKLDFQRHVAVSRSESDEPAGTILEARTKGYTLAGAVVRSAECIASLGPDEPVKPAAAAAAAEETRDEEATEEAEK